jgi:DNA polymerase-3 subunit delta
LIYVFHGDDDFSASEALGALMDAAGPPELRESNVTQLSASEFTIDRFGSAAMVVPFLAERRVVVVRGLLAASQAQRPRRGRRQPAAAKDAAPAAGLEPLLSELPPTTDVVFLEGKLPAGNALLATIRGLGPELASIREFGALRRDSLAAWVRERASQKGAAIDGAAVTELAELVGASLWSMDGELEKLATYCGGRAITKEDVAALVSGSREASVFELVDAIMDGRPEVAQGATERLMRGGATGPYLLAMIARQARLVAIAQNLAAQRVPQGEWAPRLGTGSDFVVRKTAKQARRFAPEAVRALYGLLLEADMAMKTGETTDELALTELLAQAGTLRVTARGARY